MRLPRERVQPARHGAGRPPVHLGRAHRIGYVEAVYDYIREKPGVWFTTGQQICDWHRAHPWSDRP